MSESRPIPVQDLGTMHRVYSEQGREPEVTTRLAKPRKGQPEVPDIGDTVTIATPTNGYREPDAACEAEVVAIAVVVKPLWGTIRHPWQEQHQRVLEADRERERTEKEKEDPLTRASCSTGADEPA